MRTVSKTRQRMAPIWACVAFTLAVWLASKVWYGDAFDNVYKYPAKAASLAATMLMCMTVILSARWRFLERFFGGLDKVYQIHKRIGRWAFFIILLHPFFLAFDRLPDIAAFLRSMGFQSTTDRYAWGQNSGVAALLGLVVLVALTLWSKWPYHLWKKSHEFLGLVIVLVAAHVFLVNADVARYPVLMVWFYAWLGLALLSFLYIRFLYRFFGPRVDCRVAATRRVGEILDLRFRPTGRQMDFFPGQFVYMVVRREGITDEPHPYSIANGYNLDGEIRLGIRQVGDHTRSLDRLRVDDVVSFYGPYGHFSDPFCEALRDCVFVGGGIGITPFIGMWHVALHSEDRYDVSAVKEPIRKMHPEILRSWQSPLVSLFYVCRTPEDAVFDTAIRNEVILSQFQGFSELEHRGHSYELFDTSTQGLITASYLDAHVRGGIRDKFVFLCGPTPMVDALIVQMTAMGVAYEQIIVEDFNLV